MVLILTFGAFFKILCYYGKLYGTMLADKGYIGADAYVQAILPFKKKNLL